MGPAGQTNMIYTSTYCIILKLFTVGKKCAKMTITLSKSTLALTCTHVQALSQALLQVRADLVDTAQRTLEGEAARESQESNVKELVEKRTQKLQV